MKKMTTSEIRQAWLDFFKEKGHNEEESKSLVPVNDKSLLFINSGVATLKKYFDGSEIPKNPRITNSQKSLRTNDIENVGVTSRHHTLFEMLGNFSIGEYFKEESIIWAWEFLTSEKWLALDPELLYITVHPDDIETKKIWKSIGIKDEKLVELEENFWEIGKGPGGPNTEIFFDRGIKYGDIDLIEYLKEDKENDRIIEIWNIVFSQYNCNPEIARSEYEELPKKNIDTGMGLERIACVMQETETNFETDNFMKIIKELEKITNIKYEDNIGEYRIIADHMRALVFTIADGVLPSSEGRGYVIRRLLRRSSAIGYMEFEIKEPFLYSLVDQITNTFNDYYPYLNEEKYFVKKVIKKEEENFIHTLEDGLRLINKEIKEVKGNQIKGDVAFLLYDTFGFPIEFTIEMAKEKGLTIDKDRFDELLEEQRTRARNASKNSSGMNIQNEFVHGIDKESKFVGYEKIEIKSKINLITDLNQSLDVIETGEIYILTEETPFYAESGGQVYDTGFINSNRVIDVQKLPNYQHLLKVEITEPLKLNQEVELKVDKNRRIQVTQNHSATHLLHLSLHKIIGSHAKQAGSLQDEEKTRFDFTNLEALKEKDIIEIETMVNNLINENNEVKTEEMSMDEAIKKGAQALFGEKYGDTVRVVKIGESVELCGGTHIKNSSEIEKFHILSESGVGSGVRRIEAITGNKIYQYEQNLVKQSTDEFNIINNLLNSNEIPTLGVIEQIIIKVKNLMRVLDSNELKETISQYENIITKVEELKKELKSNTANLQQEIFEQVKEQQEIKDGISYIDVEIKDLEIKDLRNLSDNLLNYLNSGVIILKLIEEDKVSVIVKASDDVTDRVKANEILKEIIEPFNGRGGGKPTMAQGGYSK